MKNGLSIVTCFLLTACALVDQNTSPDKHVWDKVDSAPLEFIQVAPSKRAIEYKAINFDRTARKIRRNLSDLPEDLYKNLRLIMLDYTEIDAVEPDEKFMKLPCYDRQYYANYNGKPRRYYLNMKFYTCNNRPPAPPAFDVTLTLDTRKAPPFGAFVTMVYEGVRDYQTYYDKTKKIEVNLDY